MFDQIAHPDGSNYPRLRQLIWGAIDQQASALTKQQQSQALSVLTYTTLVTAVACAAADALDIGRQERAQQQKVERAGWCLGLVYALSMTHPETVTGETALELLGSESMTELCHIAIPPGTDATFWGEFRVMGEALVNRLFALSPLRPERPEIFSMPWVPVWAFAPGKKLVSDWLWCEDWLPELTSNLRVMLSALQQT